MLTTGLPTLIIGVGGTGLKVLQRVKERLLETYYGEVPTHITLLELDTALQSPADNFCGVQLSQSLAQGGANSQAIQQEMRLIQSNSQFTMHDVFKQAKDKARHPQWSWMEDDKLANLLPPGAHIIIDGAGAFRPLGRTAFFLNYPEIERWMRQTMQQVVANKVAIDPTVLTGLGVPSEAQTKRNIFVVGSLAGGTGSGALLDVAAMMRRIRETDANFTNVVIIGLIALPRFFAEVTSDIGRRIPNTYAGLRELDRFMRAHKPDMPYQMMTGTGQAAEVSNKLFDLCYLVDVQDYTGNQPGNGNAELGGLPAMADLIVAHTDLKLGLRLNAANINVEALYASAIDANTSYNANYQYQSRRHYSAMNSHNVILPREDIAKALSIRFLLDLIDTHTLSYDQRSREVLVPNDPIPPHEVIALLSKDNPSAQEISAAELSTLEGNLDMGIFVRTMLAYSLSERRFSTNMPDVLKWLLEDGVQRKTVQKVVEDSLNKTTENVPDKKNMPQYIGRVQQWLGLYLGQLVDGNNPLGDRHGGAWQQAFGNLITEERKKMESRVQTLVLRLLNQRVDQGEGANKVNLLRANRLGYTLAILRALKERVRAFSKQAEMSFGEAAKNLIQLRRDLEDKRSQVTSFRGGPFAHNPGPDYLESLKAVAEAERQRLLRNLTLEMAQQFGGDIAQEGRTQSVIDVAIRELESWVAGMVKVRELIAQEQGKHEARRKQKYAIAVRTYVTDPDRFSNARQVEDGLYARYKPQVWSTLLGPDPSGGSGAGFYWEANPGSQYYFDYVITTKEKSFFLNPTKPNNATVHAMLGKGSGPEEIARVWQEGALRLLAEQVRGDRNARIAAYIPQLYTSQTTFQGLALTPNSKALVQFDGIMFEQRREEHYLAVDVKSDDTSVNTFYNWFNHNWKGDKQEFIEAESDVAASYLSLYHGLELDHIKGATDCEPAYRKMNTKEGCLHLFPEDRLAAEYESRIPLLKVPEWHAMKRLDPEIVVGLNDSRRVRMFALALVSRMLRLEEANDGMEYFLSLPEQSSVQLSDRIKINNYSTMLPNDLINARLLQAFHTFMLKERGINSTPGYELIKYDAIVPAFRQWFKSEYPDISNPEIDKLIETWKNQTDKSLLAPLFNSESRDPRFRDLGIVLLLELRAWRESRQ